MTKEFEIYFTDLTPDAQKRILEFEGVKDYKDLNWNTFPITIITLEEET